jgi:ribokinase
VVDNAHGDGAKSNGVVLSVGSINADFEVRVAEPPRLGLAQLGSDLLRTSGGKGANVAVLAAQLGVDVRLFGCVGDDDLDRQALAGPRAAGVDLSAVRLAGGATGFAMILVGPDGNKIIVVAPGANDAFSEQDSAVLVTAVHEAGERGVLVADLEVPPESIRPALVAARAAHVPTVLDPSPPGRLPKDMLPLVNHVTPNASEASEITSVEVRSAEDAAVAARRLRECGAGTAYVKLSAGGCVVASADSIQTVYAPDGIRVVDTTGAGDAFAGALAVAVLRGLPPVEAAMVAVAAASCAVSGYGAQASYPTRDELAAMTERVRDASRRQRGDHERSRHL